MDLIVTRVRRLRDSAPVGRLLLMVTVVVYIWLALSGALIEELRSEEWRVQGGFTGNGLLIYASFLSALRPSLMFLLFLAVVYTPWLIVLAGFFDRRLSIRLVLRQEYAGTLSCVLVVVAAALIVQFLPLVLVASLLRDSDAALALIFLPLPVFAVLMVPVVGVIFNLRPLMAILLTLLSLGSLIALPVVMNAAGTVCSSPLLIVLLLFLLRDRIDEVLRHSRSRDHFRRQLELATLNPADASAHYNLGLIYQQQRDLARARAAFAKAIEIDTREIDAHYQLGRIAREEGQLTEALQHFNAVITASPDHTQFEVWREIGLLYYTAGQYSDALEMLNRFVSKRPSDSEGRYWRGMVLDRLGRESEAIAEMRECVEAAQSSPAYKYRQERHWLALAKDFLRARGAGQSGY